MKITDIFRRITEFFRNTEKTSWKEYEIRTVNIRLADMPRSAFLVIKKYGWVAFFHKSAIFAREKTKKYVSKVKCLHREATCSYKQEGFRRMILRTVNYLLYGKGVLDKKEVMNRRVYSTEIIRQKAVRKNIPMYFPFKTVYYVSNISGGGAKKYITDLIDVFETSRLNFVQIKNWGDLEVYKNSFKKDDILLFQYLYDSDLTFEDIMNVKKNTE